MSNEKDQRTHITAADEDDQVEYLKATLEMMKVKKFPSKQHGFKLVTIIEPDDGGELIPIYRKGREE